jgi:hypothetical protein
MVMVLLFLIIGTLLAVLGALPVMVVTSTSFPIALLLFCVAAYWACRLIGKAMMYDPRKVGSTAHSLAGIGIFFLWLILASLPFTALGLISRSH